MCLCYNHERFVTEALFSVINQTYAAIELIVVDDASSDNSVAVIHAFLKEHPQVQFLVNEINLGNCRSFNRALLLASGTYIIDLAADDVLLDTRIEKQVSLFETLDTRYGVIFSNAAYINERSIVVSHHYQTDTQGKSRKSIPSGDVYQQVLQQYFICTPTMMMRKSVLEALGGYDESLSYEDFDFWVRSSRKYKYAYQDEILTFKRKVKGSLSTKFYQLRQNKLLESTLIVCQKAYKLNRTEGERQALATNIRYHLRQSYYTKNYPLVSGYAALLKELSYIDFITQVILWLSTHKISVWSLYKLYLRIFLKFRP
ncbi:glycosyltransferase [Rhodocytophaga rosea]|uniref:Glycosyltransferase n=1 Tax=Rhodocytophaga rosea TaxID=2704465 RepID=A0A6C0GUZ9_9BACT|nr:glycosyltransferase [Rhodocytophaga rosea]